MPIITAWVYNNNFRVSLKEYTGFRYVLYTSDGVLPSYDNTHPFEFVCKEKINNFEEDISLIEKGTHIIQYNTSVIGNIKSTFDGKISNSNNLTILSGNAYRKGLNKNQFPLKPSARYNGECVNNAVICEFKQNGVIVGWFSKVDEDTGLKHITNRNLKFQKPKASDHWDKAMMAEKKDEFVKQVEEILKRRARELYG